MQQYEYSNTLKRLQKNYCIQIVTILKWQIFQMQTGQPHLLIGDQPQVTVKLLGETLSWRSKKQSVISRSSAESEYLVMAHLTCDQVWVKDQLEFGFTLESPIMMYCDNKVAIHNAKNIYFTSTQNILRQATIWCARRWQRIKSRLDMWHQLISWQIYFQSLLESPS